MKYYVLYQEGLIGNCHLTYKNAQHTANIVELYGVNKPLAIIRLKEKKQPVHISVPLKEIENQLQQSQPR